MPCDGDKTYTLIPNGSAFNVVKGSKVIIWEIDFEEGAAFVKVMNGPELAQIIEQCDCDECFYGYSDDDWNDDEGYSDFDDPFGECMFPGRCVMPGPHHRDECCTAEMMEEMCEAGYDDEL